jgi:DNA repair protein RadC
MNIKNNNHNDKPHFSGHRKRLKDRFLKNSENFADYELLELMLTFSIPRKDVKPLAKKMLDFFGSFSRILNASHEEFEEFKGVSNNTQTLIKMINEISSRALLDKLQKRDVLLSPQEVLDFVRSKIGNAQDEVFLILFLNKKNHLIAYESISQGTTDRAVIYPKNVIKQALKYNATAVLAVHNHPSGICDPSAADLAITSKIKDALYPLDINFLDHIIVGTSDYFSFKEENIL